MSMIRKIRAWSGKKLENFLWRFLHGKVEALAQHKAENLQQLLRREWRNADEASENRLQAQMNFQPTLAEDWQRRVKRSDTYVGFENIFRDSNIIAQRNQRYLPYFAGANSVLDVGCGRGEFLEMLEKNGIEATGIDSSAEMIEACQKKGLKNVKVAEALPHLSSLPENSQGGIFSCHVLEHLPIDDVIKFFPLAWKSLQADGTLIIETPNPHSLPAFKLFWLDPTHIRPLFPEFLEWAARAGGFTDVQILYLTDQGFSPTHGPWLGNYALIAKKN